MGPSAHFRSVDAAKWAYHVIICNAEHEYRQSIEWIQLFWECHGSTSPAVNRNFKCWPRRPSILASSSTPSRTSIFNWTTISRQQRPTICWRSKSGPYRQKDHGTHRHTKRGYAELQVRIREEEKNGPDSGVCWAARPLPPAKQERILSGQTNICFRSNFSAVFFINIHLI